MGKAFRTLGRQFGGDILHTGDGIGMGVLAIKQFD
jgi:hypothetical protein